MKVGLTRITALITAGGLIIGLVSWAAWPAAHNAIHSQTVKTIESPTANVQEQSEQEQPVYIAVPRLGIGASVIPGIYDAKQNAWNVSEDNAHFATITEKPNSTAGMTLIYAHNMRSLFGNLKNINTNDLVRVQTESGRVFEYIYEGDTVVDPPDTEIFHGSKIGAPRLVLLTCTGAWHQHRRLLNFKYWRSIL
jgi:LPXTG-site transpeptidase (sortase) family protein